MTFLQAATSDLTAVPAGFTRIRPAHHPDTGEVGILLRHNHTGLYILWTGDASKSVPHNWAKRLHQESTT